MLYMYCEMGEPWTQHERLPVARRHAILMLFFFIMPGVMSGLGNLLVPIQLGVPELMFPKVNNVGDHVLNAGACTHKHGLLASDVLCDATS
jgi:heme/copper-type cytochrome/quinol oxidase subunit 1